MVQDVGHLGRGKSPVHGNGDRIDLGGTEQHGEVLGHVLVEERDPILIGNTGGKHGLGHLARFCMELGVGPRVVVLDQRNLVGTLVRVIADQFTNGR